METELYTCRENLERSIADKDCLQRQTMAQILEIDRLRQEKEASDLKQRVMEREIAELKEKLSSCNRTLASCTGNVSQQEATICQLRGVYKINQEHYKGRYMF